MTNKYVTYKGTVYSGINVFGRDFILQETWGKIHKGKPWWWYDKTAVRKPINGTGVELRTHYNPKYFPTLDVKSEIGAGLICCLDKFHFGKYKFVFTLPKGSAMFPGIWMYRHPDLPPVTMDEAGNWLPEYDFMEAYSKANGSYKSFNLGKLRRLDKIESNFHFWEGEKKYMLGINRFNLGFSAMFNSLWNGPFKPITIEVDWTESHLIQKVNGSHHRTLKGDIMKHLQEPMRIVMNNGIRNSFQYKKKEITIFTVHDMEYSPY